MSLTYEVVQKNLVAVHKAGGSMDDVVLACHPGIEKGTDAFKKAKGTLNVMITGLRKDLIAACKEKGLPVENVNIVLPKFREATTHGDKKGAVTGLLALLSAADAPAEGETETATE
jgi:hypothetical protein